MILYKYSFSQMFDTICIQHRKYKVVDFTLNLIYKTVMVMNIKSKVIVTIKPQSCCS